jgi:hypothetical protein
MCRSTLYLGLHGKFGRQGPTFFLTSPVSSPIAESKQKNKKTAAPKGYFGAQRRSQMRRRLYFLLPDLSIARQVMDDLLLARIEARRIHVLARRGTDLEDIPEASVLQKTDVVHGAQVGAVLGAFAGALGGMLLVAFPPHGLSMQLVTVLIAALLGALFGVWAASLAGASVPNSKLKQFQPWIDQGRLLLMVDVPLHRCKRITELVTRRHPEAVPGGTEPTIPAFP